MYAVPEKRTDFINRSKDSLNSSVELLAVNHFDGYFEIHVHVKELISRK